ncbi:hypothetical protein ABZP36_034355 [Zizania latifolia]
MASSAAVKMAVICMLVVLSVAGQLTTVAEARGDEATLLRLQELEEEVLGEELALLDDGAVGATVCTSNCKKCLVKCAGPCFRKPPTFVTCFLKCAITNDCFGKK